MQIVVAMPFHPDLPLDPDRYTEDYVNYIADLLPSKQYDATGYFVTLENIPQFLTHIEKLYKKKRKICVLNFCDGGEWDGYPGISLNRMWEKHPISELVSISGADALFILNSDDKLRMQKHLCKAHLPCLPQTLIQAKQKIDKNSFSRILVKEKLDQRWPLFCKLNIGAGALGISNMSICRTIEELIVQVNQMQSDFPTSDIIIQPYLPGPEYTVLVLKDRVYAAVQRDFHNPNNIMLEDYLLGNRPVEEEITYYPAPMDVQLLALEAIKAIPGKHHYTRVDMRNDASGTTYVIDINERPGFGNPSTVKCMLEYLHLNEAKLLQEIIDTCGA